MSLLHRFLGLPAAEPQTDTSADTHTVREIAARLDRLEPATARYLAAFAYVLARVAHVDLKIDDAEVAEMERIVAGLARLDPEETQLVVAIARTQARFLAGTENYLVTREFRRNSSREQRLRLVECLFAVAAADGSISTSESQEVLAIAEELRLSRAEALALRSQWRDHLAVLQGMPSNR